MPGGDLRRLDSPNVNDRAGGVRPSILILHYTGTDTAQDAEDCYMNVRPDPVAGPVSPHYMIDTDGTVTQFVDESRRAWHAGLSWWAGWSDINSHSIGIELVNPGHAGGCRPFPPAQMDSLTRLAAGILARHAIPPHNVLGHSDIAAARKADPGEWMDWAWLAARGVGLWPDPDASDYARAEIWLDDMPALRDALTAYGYDPGVADSVAIRAFQQHYHTEIFATPDRAGRADRDTAARLSWLVRRKAAFKA